jgi:DNA-binding SARP family transcriptional activator
MIYVQILSLISRARGFADYDSHDKVMNNLHQARALLTDTCLSHLESEILLTEAYSLLRRGDRAQGLSNLEHALRQARGTGYSYHMRWCSTMPLLCAEALAAGIEVEYVREVIKKYRLRPPSSAIDEWPWPVKIFTLGRFEIVLNGESVTFSGKAPRKPLALLKALIAFGGRNVPEERLMDALWPDEEADGARKSLDVTVLRLRKLLGSHEAIVVSDEAIGLNPRLCWTDVGAFERRVERIESGEERAGVAAEVLRLYRGNFLPGDADEPWTAKTRERLRSKFVRLTEAVALEEERTGRWDHAIALYLKGLEADDLVEPFYQGLMRCYRALGRHAEAMSAYRRVRQLLSVVLGIAPSEPTQTLARALQRDNPAQFESSQNGSALGPERSR